ncbi:acyl carrier protein [Actinokineospora soli]|uniref:Acyl carrier protein n=1 Tax=Actinokineospora soli TaxID=1048753 RepID=A0ABW2TV44_9PSEU
MFEDALGAPVPDDATFVALGGDSLTYVRTSVALERLVGTLPEDWPRMTVAALESLRRPPRRLPRVETDIVLRAVAIVTVVASHVGIGGVLGGAHLLLAIAGWNFARFLLPGTGTRIARSAALVAAPAFAWLVFRWFAADDVTVVHLVFADNFVYTGAIGYWFVEVLLHALLVLALLFAIPAVRRWERAHGFAFALAALAAAYALRLAFVDDQVFFDRNLTTVGAVWFFPLGWLAYRARTPAQKRLVLGIALVLITGNFGDLPRGGVHRGRARAAARGAPPAGAPAAGRGVQPRRVLVALHLPDALRGVPVVGAAPAGGRRRRGVRAGRGAVLAGGTAGRSDGRARGRGPRWEPTGRREDSPRCRCTVSTSPARRSGSASRSSCTRAAAGPRARPCAASRSSCSPPGARSRARSARPR